MDFLKKLWPTPFKIRPKDVTSFVIQLVIFIVICAIGGLAIGLLSGIPVVNIIAGIVGAVLDLYGLIGIILCVLVFLDVDAVK